ncbi:MAG: CHASE2 domain-containing protein [Acidobacteriia bacterium]|nr:CHASE2 domain-containing protein [Terriglobia bacterium]
MRFVGVVVLICVGLVFLFQPRFVANLDQKTCDMLTRRVDRGRLSGSVVIVQIDESSLAQYGRWPWPRDLLGMLIRRILEGGADTVALDMMFPEPDLREVTLGPSDRATFTRPAPGSVPTHHPRTADDFFAESLGTGRVIVGYHLEFGADHTSPHPCILHPLPLAMVDTETTRGPAFFRASGAVCSVPEISRAAAGSGFLNASVESDGILRRVPLLIAYGEDVYPSLSLAAFMAYKRNPTARLTTSSRGAVEFCFNDVTIPLDSRSNLILRFRGGPGTFPRVSAADVLARRVPAMALHDKIVIVGVSAVGLQDVVPTPVDRYFPGSEVHATAIDNLLQDDPFRRSTMVLAGELALMLVLGLASGVLFAWVSPSWVVPVAVSLIFPAWLLSALLLSRAGVYLSPLPVTAVLVGNLGCLTLWRVSTEKRRADRQLETARKFILAALSSLTTIRDVETGTHLLRVQRYTEVLCKAIARNPRFHRFLTSKTIALIVQLVQIHDIGKVGIPDHILRKPGRLTPEEFEIMKTHTGQGLRVIQSASVRSQIQDETTLNLACEIVHSHHERWDGTGYPLRLSGDNIPIAARLLAVADVYDALISRRIYKEGMTHEEAVKFIADRRGTLFDPDVVDAFLRIHESMHQIQKECRDQNELPLMSRIVGPSI